jgi:hypothetical protein
MAKPPCCIMLEGESSQGDYFALPCRKIGTDA